MSKTKPAAIKPAETAMAVTHIPLSNKKVIVIAIMVAVIAGGLGGYVGRGNSNTPHIEEIKVAPPRHPLFVALEPFTVNLQKETSDQYLQVGISLKYFDDVLEDKIKASLPEIRGKILLLLSTKKVSELSSAEGKMLLVEEIIALSNGVLGIDNKPSRPAPTLAIAKAVSASQVSAAEPARSPAPRTEEKKGIVDVLFTSFIIQ